MKRLVRNLRDASVDAFVMALETVNRVSVPYRLEASTILFCNAWELLMKAKLMDEGQRIFPRKPRGEPRRSLALDECLGRLYTNAHDPVRLNVETLSEMRNNAMHLVIPFIPPDVLGLLQANVLNYTRFLLDWFGVNLSDRVPIGMMSLVYDFDPAEFALNNPRIRRKLTKETVVWLADLQNKINSTAGTLGDTRSAFVVPIDFKLAYVRNPRNADIQLSFGGTAGISGVVIERTRDVEKTHPWYEAGVVAEVNSRLAKHGVKVNGHDIRVVRKVHNIPDKGDFVWRGDRTRYSPRFVEWVVGEFERSPNLFVIARERARRRRN